LACHLEARSTAGVNPELVGSPKKNMSTIEDLYDSGPIPIEPNKPDHWCGEPWRVINKENTGVEAEEPRHRRGESRGHISGKLETERYVRTSQLYRKKDIRLQVLYRIAPIMLTVLRGYA
jgi:hypothetical protein